MTTHRRSSKTNTVIRLEAYARYAAFSASLVNLRSECSILTKEPTYARKISNSDAASTISFDTSCNPSVNTAVT